MTDHARAIEAGAKAIHTFRNSTRETQAKACIEAAIASGALVPASAVAEMRERCAAVVEQETEFWPGAAADSLRVAAAAIRQLDIAPASGGHVVVPRGDISGLLVEDDSDDADDECELCGGRGTVDAYTSRTEGQRQEGRDEIGCPACIERQHSRTVRAMLSAANSNGGGK